MLMTTNYIRSANMQRRKQLVKTNLMSQQHNNSTTAANILLDTENAKGYVIESRNKDRIILFFLVNAKFEI